MKTLESIESKIAALQVERESLLARERDAVIDRCREAIKRYSITYKELTGKRTPGEVTEPSPKSLSMRGRIKYRLGENTWSGFGRPPRWVTEYLAEKKSNKLERLLVEESPS